MLVRGSVKYLEARFDAMGEVQPSIAPLYGHVENLSKSKVIKPIQKNVCLRDFLMPRYLYALKNGLPKRCALVNLDTKIRNHVNE